MKERKDQADLGSLFDYLLCSVLCSHCYRLNRPVRIRNINDASKQCLRNIDTLSHIDFIDNRTSYRRIRYSVSNSLASLVRVRRENTGGKGTPRRKVVKKSQAASQGDDRKLQAALKKLNVTAVGNVEEVNMFKDDGNVLHFAAPRGKSSQYTRRGVTCILSVPSTRRGRIERV